MRTLHRKPVAKTMQVEHLYMTMIVCQTCHSFGTGWAPDPKLAEEIARDNLMSWECPQTPLVGQGSTVMGNGASYVAGPRNPA